MINRLKKTLKHTFVYGIGSLATKVVGIALLPLYTKHLTVSDYGVLGVFEVTLFILAEFFTFGQKSSILRFYHLTPYKEKPKSTVYSISIFLIISTAAFTTAIYFLSTPISKYFQHPSIFATYFKLSAGIIFLRVLNGLFLNVLRVREKSNVYVISNLIKLTISLVLNIYFIAYARMGVSGIMLSYLISETILLILLLPSIIPTMSVRFNTELVKSSLTYGFPLIFNSLAAMLLNMGNRYILKLLIDYKDVGLFSLAHKIAGLLNVFVIQSFALSFIPLAYKIYGQKGDKRYYSKLLTYFSFILVWVGLGISLFNREVVQIFSKNTDYWDASPLVPILILSYIFSGAKTVASLGLFLERKTKYIAYSTIVSLVINIGLCFIFIPIWGKFGAAYAGLISFIFLYGISYLLSQKYYPVPYENTKLLKLLLTGLSLYFIGEYFFFFTTITTIFVKLCILLLFPLILFCLGFYDKIEIDTILNGLTNFFKHPEKRS